MSTPAFVRKVELIEKLLKDKQYTTAARECLIMIEGGLREVLINNTDKLAEDDKQRVRAKEAELVKGSRAKSFKDFTLGQLVGVVRESEFFEALAKISHRQLPKLINFNELNSLRIELLHAEGWTTQRETTKQEADLLFSLLKSFDEVLQLSANPLLIHLKQELFKLSLKPRFRQQVINYLKVIENKAIDDEAAERIQVIEEFISGQCTAEDFEEFWQDQQNQQSTALNYAALLARLKLGRIALFLGSEIPEQVTKKLLQETNQSELLLTELCEFIELEQDRLTLYHKIEEHSAAVPLSENLRTLAGLLAQSSEPVIIISVDCNNLIQQVFSQHGKKFVVFSPETDSTATDSEYSGKFILEYSDKANDEKFQKVSAEELSALRPLELGYSLIYKIRGCFSLNDEKSSDKDCLVLSERDYFALARYPNHLVPEYLALLLRQRSLWFLGHRPDSWYNRLLMKAILEKRSNSLSYAVDEQLTPFTQVYWKTSRVENYQMGLTEFVRNLQQAQNIE